MTYDHETVIARKVRTLISSVGPFIEWLFIHPTPPPTEEQYGKMESKYPEGGHCQSVLRPHGVFNVPLF